MDAFWTFARSMLRYRRLVILAMLFAALSAAGVGVGLVTIKPVLDIVLGGESGRAVGLPELLQKLDTESPISGWVPNWLIDAAPEGPFTAVVVILCGLGLLTVLGATANFLHQYFALTVVHRTVANVRRKAFGTLVHLPLAQVVAQGSGDSVSRVVNDTAHLAQGLNALLSKAVAQVTKGLG
ncbi:MAG: ABC transporter transmembrane domain-containing protein, partial [Phycisphaerales bacterium JB059]